MQLRVSTLWTPVIVSKMSICPHWAGRVLAESFQLMEKTVSSLQGLGGMPAAASGHMACHPEGTWLEAGSAGIC